jgi:mercuric ion transport protein
VKSIRVPIIGAVITALLSTLCCLPAFLFLFFGISSGVLSYFTALEYTRVPLSILAIIFFIFASRNLKQKISCKCSKKEIYKQYFLFVLFFISLMGLLFYPEFLTLFMD